MPPNIKKMFVLMLENRSYDNIFGYSDFKGRDPSGADTAADSLIGKAPIANADKNGLIYTIGQGAPFSLQSDPGHEFSDTLAQLCGANSVSVADCQNDSANAANYPDLKPVDDPNKLGFAYSLSAHGSDVASALRCFTPDQLPVLNFLASQFAVCDRWFSSMPGPTWPNRFFALAGTSWGLDHSPTTAQIFEADIVDGNAFGNGSDSLFTRLAPQEWIVAYGDTPQSFAIKGVREQAHNFIRHPNLWSMLQTGTLDANFIFIEPNYDPGLDSSFGNGDSMHPKGDVRKGEALIEKMYNAIKDSPYWEECVFVIVFDEHGGFFDHVIPDSVATGKHNLAAAPATSLTQRGFQFDRYGFRVPAIVISPYIEQATIDHSFYDHVSIAKTLQLIVNHSEPLLDVPRYVQADDFGKLLTLDSPRKREDIPPCPNALPITTTDAIGGASKTAMAFANLGWQS